MTVFERLHHKQPHPIRIIGKFKNGGITVTVKDLKIGEYFTLKPYAEPTENQVYIRGEYDRSERKYDCGKFSDISYSRLLKGNTVVYTDFTF